MAVCMALCGCVSHRYQTSPLVSPLDPWEGLGRTESGTEVRVELQTGSVVSGRFETLTDNAVVIEIRSGERLDLPKADVRRVAKAAADTLAEGGVFGALGGALMGLVATQAASDGASAAEGFGVNLGFFTGLGLFLDWRSQEHELLYGEPD
jgi:hypothetical protein